MARAPVADRFPFSLLTAGKTFEDYAPIGRRAMWPSATSSGSPMHRVTFRQE
jgi:hypothetical protein